MWSLRRVRSNLLPIAIIAAVLLTAGFLFLEYDILVHFEDRSPEELLFEIEEALVIAMVLICALFAIWYRRSRAHRKELERRLAAETKARNALELALLDPLTGLANRRHFDEIFNAAAGKGVATRHALLLLDIDDFKPINDIHGHPVGDEVLRIISERLKHAVKARDLVSRLGGDEFSVIVFETKTDAAATEVADRLQAVVAEPIVVSGNTFQVAVSIGYTLFPEEGRAPAEIYARADQALYVAKAHKHQQGHKPVLA